MSQTPVREALARLAQEGFIENRAQKGYFTKTIDLQEISELYALINLHTNFLLRRLHQQNRLPGTSELTLHCFNDCTPTCAMQRMLSLQAHLHVLAGLPNAGSAHRNMLLRSYFFRMVEYNDPHRFAALSAWAREFAELARTNDVDAAIGVVDTAFRARAAWSADVFQTANRIASRMTDHDGATVARLKAS